MLTFFRRKNGPEQVAAETLYSALLVQSRQPVFYTDLWVPDTVDGRFDMVLLHSFVVLRHLGRADQAGGNRADRALSQAVYDVMFVDMDRAVREIGVGDLSIKKHIRRMMKAFNGRMAAYEAGMSDDPALFDALRRNVYGTVEGEIPAWVLDSMGVYLKESVGNIATLDRDALVKNTMIWGNLPDVTLQKRAEA